jgi:NAD(P) transhydrogenase subunit alpha
MPVCIGVLAESAAGERRVAMSPEVAKKLKALGATVLLQSGAGAAALQPDERFEAAEIASDAATVLARADVLLKVQPPSGAEVASLKAGAMIIGYFAAHKNLVLVKSLAARNITALAMELVPRISRAQSMDALSSQAAAAGYKAVLLGASLSGQFFPMLTTAAGTIRPSRVFVIGAGVAGLQAIATARRLGAIVEGYDVRAATKEQVESLGAKFVSGEIKAEGSGGYARELTTEEKAAQAGLLARHLAQADVVISTAAIPGRPSPRLITADMVRGMKPGAVIVDLAAEGGGNCELTQPGQTIQVHGVTIDGPLNVPATLPVHASEMYAKNLLNLLQLMLKDGELKPDWEDEILKGALLTRDGAVVHTPTRQLLEAAP